MKKLIALAVAAAAVPAMAAVTISGQTEVSYSNKDAGTAIGLRGGADAAAAESKTLGTEDTSVTFAASSELDNGMAISTSYTLFSAGNAVSNDGGEGAVTVSGSFGSLSVGDVAGPLDARDGQAAATAANDLSAAYGVDMAAVYTLPTLVEGLSISAGMAPKNGGDTGVMTDGSGVAFDYTVGGFKVYAGMESSKTTVTVAAVTEVNSLWTSSATFNAPSFASAAGGATTAPAGFDTLVVAGTAPVAASTTVTESDVVGYGVSYTVAGLTVAANFAEDEQNNGTTVTKFESTAYGVSYTTGALTLAYNAREDEQNGVKLEEADTASVAYSLGGGASVYAATTSRDIGKNDESTVGIKFAF